VRIVPNFIPKREIKALQYLIGMMRDEPGRLATGYRKAPILPGTTLMGCNLDGLRHRALNVLGTSEDQEHDCYLIRYDKGAFIPSHFDSAPTGAEHHRLNALVEAGDGGDLMVSGKLVALKLGDAYVFRPDAEEHEVKRVRRGRRLIFSVGTLLRR
jgi:hypothetical protein